MIARAAGISVWQFTAPALLTGLFIGVVAVAVYNPGAVYLQSKSDQVAEGLFSVEQTYLLEGSGEVWLRQNGTDGESVLHARHTTGQGATLNGVTIFSFDRQGEFSERIEARSAVLEEGMWRLSDAIVYALDTDPQHYGNYTVSTFLTPTEVKESIGAPESISFWSLPRFIELSQRAGLPAYRYSLQYQSLLAKPLLLVAMIVIAAAVSLRVSRFGGIAAWSLGALLPASCFMLFLKFQEIWGEPGLFPQQLQRGHLAYLGFLWVLLFC